METERLKEQFLELKKKVDEIDSRIQSLMPAKFSKSNAFVRNGETNAVWMGSIWILGETGVSNFGKLENMKSDLQWAKRAAPERVPDVKNKILEFVSTKLLDGWQAVSCENRSSSGREIRNTYADA
jgi:hypothetical protein